MGVDGVPPEQSEMEHPDALHPECPGTKHQIHGGECFQITPLAAWVWPWAPHQI